MAINILQIDTSTPVCSVALSCDGKTLRTSTGAGQNAHASGLTTQIAGLMDAHQLQYADLSAIAVAKGPGSYTGLRIGVSTAKGICYAANLPLIAIDSLRMLAEGFQYQKIAVGDHEVAVGVHKSASGAHKAAGIRPDHLLCPMIDARRMEVYMAIYSADMDLVRATAAVIIDDKSFDFLQENQKIYLFGSGADKFEMLFENHPQVQVIPGVQADASTISAFAYEACLKQDFENTAYFEPFYLKDFIPTTPRNR